MLIYEALSTYGRIIVIIWIERIKRVIRKVDIKTSLDDWITIKLTLR